MATAILQQIHPVLPVRNVSRAIHYYVDKLGFKLSFKDAGNDPKYAGVQRDAVEIHLQWHDENDWTNGMDSALLRIYVTEVDSLFNDYKTKDVFHNNTMLRDTAWRTREFGIYDCDSNGLIFYRDL
ncbi:glyoxalase superfamily protein [Psychroserpens sp. SPM9]|uniref:glyoxalase superfamily protein n=1 Tax=Psychroserpens sp. SPM9 TaxID=2975598 RepID=UPI0021A5EEAB|nr:glyoxalase superfamily protein [Psychroserpens sp. SPM9]MDG5492395.1 glyoxalase superfamily protein [Psychroserpens sp. SPM9]